MQEIENLRGKIRNKYHDLFEYSLDLIYVCDLWGRFIDANEKTITSLGFTMEELSKSSFKDFIDREQEKKASEVLREIKEFGRQLKPSVYKLRNRDGKIIYLETYEIPIFHNNKIYAILVIAKDITINKRSEEIIKSFNLYLEHKIKKKIHKLRESARMLRESNETLKNVFLHSPDSIVISDLKGNIIDCNDATLNMSGFKSKKDLIGKSAFTLIDPEDHKNAAENLKRTMEIGVSKDLEYTLIKKGGERYSAEISASLIRDINNVPSKFMAILKDISERKEYETKLLKSENALKERLKELYCLYQLSVISEGKDLTLDEIIKEIIKIIPEAWQYPEKLCVKVKYRSKVFISENFRETKWVQTSNVFIHGYILRLSVYYLKNLPFLNEEQLLLNEISKRLKFIIEKRENEGLLKESEKKFRFLFDNSPNTIILIDNMRIVRDVNLRVEEMLGYKKAELIGEHFPELPIIQKADLQFALETFENLSNGIIPNNIELRLMKKDETLLWSWITVSFVKIEGENMVQVNIQDLSRIKESEEKYKTLFESSQDGILMTSLEGDILDCNKALLQILGYSLEEIKKLNFFKITPQNWQNMENEIINNQVFVRGFSEIYEKEMFKKNGEKIPVNINLWLRMDEIGNIQALWAMVRDITNRKKAENEIKQLIKKLKTSEENLRNIFDNTNDAIYIHDLNGNIMKVNETAVSLMGYSEEELLKMKLVDLQSNEKSKNYPKDFYYFLDHEPSLVESVNITKEGKNIPIEVGRKIIKYQGQTAILAIARNISERKKSELKLRQSEEKYRDLFTNSPNGIILVNGDGIIMEVNPITEMILGYKADYFIGKKIEELNIFVKNNKISLGQIMNELMNNLNIHESIELQIKKDNDELSWIHLQPSSINRGSQQFFQWVIQDINLRKEIDRLRDKFTSELEDAVRKRTKELNQTLSQQQHYLDQIIKSSQFKTEFLATMSHELRTPLNAIIGFTDLLLEGAYGELNKNQLDFLKDIRSSAQHQFEMIQQILDITKIESGKLHLKIRKFSLNNMIDQVISTFKPMCSKKNLNLLVKGVKKPIEIYADPIRLKEILFNLVDNAIKFTIEGKVILTFKEDQKNWLFKVQDTGIGIADKDYNIIFKEFKRVDSTYVNCTPGTGLGLSLTKRIINLHGGNIEFTSVLGVGTAFTFNIPKVRFSE